MPAINREYLKDLLFSTQGHISRSTYAKVGFSLMLFKYLVDVLAYYLAWGNFWTPIHYFSPLFSTRLGPFPTYENSKDGLSAFLVIMVLWTLPFIWVGFACSLKRCRDAGLKVRTAFFFLIPVVNYLFMLLLCVLPHKPNLEELFEPTETDHYLGKSIAMGIAGGVAFCLICVALVNFAIQDYGLALFLLSPVVIGFSSTFQRARLAPLSPAKTVGISVLSVLISYLLLLLFALEGLLCITMALPLALPFAILGGFMGMACGSGSGVQYSVALPTLALATLGVFGLEKVERQPYMSKVTTEISIELSAKEVWPHVIQFTELPKPTWFFFDAGISYPIRARIEGQGVGAVRYCEFSTGAFVEPITEWNEGKRLAFDVAEQPDTMHEWSFYGHIHPPHLRDYFSSKKGAFDFVEENGKTKLIGTTWYQLNMGPYLYWEPVIDFILTKIHTRVLTHIRDQALASKNL